MLASLLTQPGGLSSEAFNVGTNSTSRTLALECRHFSPRETDPAPDFLGFKSSYGFQHLHKNTGEKDPQ